MRKYLSILLLALLFLSPITLTAQSSFAQSDTDSSNPTDEPEDGNVVYN